MYIYEDNIFSYFQFILKCFVNIGSIKSKNYNEGSQHLAGRGPVDMGHGFTFLTLT